MFASICILSLSSSAFSLELAGRIATTNGAASVSSLSMNQDPYHTSDVFYGTDSKGPYTLSWKPIEKFSEDVSVDGKSAQRGLDYDFDYTQGKITFFQSISTSQGVKIQYRCNFSAATRNENTLSTPLSIDVIGGGGSGIKIMGLYNQGTGSSKNGTGLAAVGLSGTTSIAGVGFNSMFLTAPGDSGDSNSRGLDRTAISLGGSTKRGGLELTSSFNRVGAGFASARSYNLTQGQQAINFAAKYQASRSLNLISSYNRTDSLASGSVGQATTTTSQGMVFTPNSGSKLSFTRTDVNSESPGSSATTTATNRMDLSQALGSRVNASASYQDVTSQTDGIANHSVTNQLSLDAKPVDTVSIRTQMVDQTTTAYGKDQTQTIALSAAPNSRVKLDMAAKHEQSVSLGSAMSESLHLVTSPTAAWNLDYAMAGSSASAQPSTDASTQAVKLQTTAVKNTMLQLNWGLSDSASCGSSQDTGMRVETSPWKMLKITGALGQKQVSGSTEQNREAGLEISPLKDAKLAGGYKEVEKSDGTLSRITEVSASGKPINFLALSGGYKTRQQGGQADVNSMNVAVQLNPGRLLSLTGAYSMNPEDSYGTVQKVNSQTLGMQSNLGAVSLKGAFTRKDDYTANTHSQVTQVGMDYHLTSTSLLTTSYSLEDMKDTCDLMTSTYALTLSHKVGSSLSLYLTGKAVTYQGSQGTSTVSPNTYEGEASLGIKF